MSDREEFEKWAKNFWYNKFRPILTTNPKIPSMYLDEQTNLLNLTWQAATKASEAKLASQEPVYQINALGFWRDVTKEEYASEIANKYTHKHIKARTLYASPQAQPDLEAKLLQAEARIKELEDLCAELYQVLGCHDASEKALDNCLAGAQGDKIPHDDLLPYEVTQSTETLDRYVKKIIGERDAD